MITESNFKSLLLFLGFTNNNNLYEKVFPSFGISMRVDFTKMKLYYPDAIKGRERNAGFDKPENFVVFECVNRLLEKGYRPEHIELEKEWHLGHDAKSGRADVCVTDAEGSMLFIVECKTWGKEFNKALSDTKNDGGQLFSYWQQEQSCKWLVLYTSDFRDNNVEYKAPTIDCSDDANILLLAKKDKSIKPYRNAHTAQEKHEAWKETYASQIHDDLIFSDDSVAYKIGVKPLIKKNLCDFTPDDKIVNRFEEILRHNNVSDKENAFNRLIALFICKLVDESTKDENDEVEFQYKHGTDTYETLQDRLQRLHRDGMEKFMREKIYYVPADYPEWLFSTYTGSKRKRAIEDLQNTIRILKFYSNNDFAFKDVHNEELFYQNGKILVEMVQLFEKYKIVYPSKHQFLGDLFEQLLNKGFKQNEGQFFTPMPITRFIWDSLPIERMVKSGRGTVYPRVIDYACGAGHFLTDAIEAINHFTQSGGDNSWARDHIFGIEKDYRLARVSKISLFMNGAGEGNIIFGDGLENIPDKGIDNGTFDILVANPPYSVKYFKQHLQLKNNSFVLLDRIGLNGGEIETLFVERIGQLLKPQGIAAVILPSSILSNDSASYTGAREQFLQNFYIRAIVSLGSKTFGATGTNTVIMFLEKFNEPPKQIDLSSDSVDAIFNGTELKEWKDKEILEAYVAQIDVDEDVYGAFLNKCYSLDELNAIEHFKMYVESFVDSPDARNLQKTKVYKKMSVEDQEAAYLDKFYAYAHSIEKEKLFYFSIVYQQTTVIINAPVDNKAQKDFLGYEWSNSKGKEGIQIITPGGKMYNDSDRAAEGTLASAIKQSFEGNEPAFSEDQQEFGMVVDTKDILDFSSPRFIKTMALYGKCIPKYQSKYPLQSLGKLSKEPKYGANEQAVSGDPNVDYRYIRITDITDDGYLGPEWMTAKNIDNQYILQDGDFLFARTGATAGKYLLYESKYGKAIYAGYLIRFQFDSSVVLPKYIKNVLKLKPYTEWAEYNRRGRNINATRYSAFQIPLPPMDIQKKIVSDCTVIDVEYDNTRKSLEVFKKELEELFSRLENSTSEWYRLSDIFEWVTTKTTTASISSKSYVTTDTMLQKCAGITDYTEPMPESNVTAFEEGDILLSNIRPYLQKLWLSTFSGGCSNDVLVLRTKDCKDHNPAFYAAYLKRQAFFDYIMQDVNGAKMPRGKKPHIINYRVPKIDIQEQNKIVTNVETIETQILEAEKKLDALSEQTVAILNQYLN